MMNTRAHEQALQQAWEDYHENGSIQARDFIILSYKPFVSKIARDVMRKKPSNFDHEDLLQTGMIGLMSALERYDPTKGASFSTFASMRVKGSMYDEINALDWTPRSVREKIKLVIRAIEQHSKNNNTTPTMSELGDIIRNKFKKEITDEQVQQAYDQSYRTHIHAIDSKTTIEQEETRLGFSIVNNNPQSIEEIVSQNLLGDLISDILDELCTEFEKFVFYGVHVDGKAMRAVASELGVPVTRVSAARHKVDKMLQDEMRERGILSYLRNP